MYPKTMESLIGKTFNYWKILKARPNNLKGMVLAECICGKKTINRGRCIIAGLSKSCGCKRKEYARRGKRSLDGTPALNKCYSFYQTRAFNKGLEFNISKERFKELTSLTCYYCDSVPNNAYTTNTDTYQYNGLDRIDNSIGYIESNVKPCCIKCNTLKGGITKDMIIKLYYLFQNNNA